MRPPEDKNILVNINTNSDLESNATLGIDYTNNDKEVDIKFISDNITISPSTNNSAMLNIIALKNEQLKEPKQILIKILENISFPPTITNRGGDTYYNNKTIIMLEFSDLILTVLPPLTFSEQLDNFTKSIQPFGDLWRVLTTIGLGISGIIAFLYKKRKDKQGSIAEANYDRKKIKKDNNSFEGKKSSPI